VSKLAVQFLNSIWTVSHHWSHKLQTENPERRTPQDSISVIIFFTFNCFSFLETRWMVFTFGLVNPDRLWISCPENESSILWWSPFVETRIILPSGLNLRPVQSDPESATLGKSTWLRDEKLNSTQYNLLPTLNEENGPLSKLLRSYSFKSSELIPAAKIRPSGSKAATGFAVAFRTPWQPWDLRSHSLIVLSSEPERKVSSVGDVLKVTTRFVWPLKREARFYILLSQVTFLRVPHLK